MYRIHFDHQIGKFVLQVSAFGGFWWSTVKNMDGDGYAFETFNEATAHVSKIGLDQLYKDKSANQFHEYIMGR